MSILLCFLDFSSLPVIRKCSLSFTAINPQSTMFIGVCRLVRRKAPSSLAIYPFENVYSVAFIEESSTFSISHFACARDKSGVASQSSTATRLAASSFARRTAPSNAAAGQPGTALLIR